MNLVLVLVALLPFYTAYLVYSYSARSIHFFLLFTVWIGWYVFLCFGMTYLVKKRENILLTFFFFQSSCLSWKMVVFLFFTFSFLFFSLFWDAIFIKLEKKKRFMKFFLPSFSLPPFLHSPFSLPPFLHSPFYLGFLVLLLPCFCHWILNGVGVGHQTKLTNLFGHSCIGSLFFLHGLSTQLHKYCLN